MRDEVVERIASLRSLSCTERFTAAVKSLATAASQMRGSEARRHLRAAHSQLRSLPMSMRRLAWLQTFGMPAARRTGASRLQLKLWHCGISRSAPAQIPLSGAAHLIAAWSDASDEASTALLRDIASCDAFAVLLVNTSDDALVWEAVALVDAVDADGVARISKTAEQASLPKLQEIADLAAWLQALIGKGSPLTEPPDSRLTEIALALPALRGLRRRGARRLGENIGKQVRMAMRTLSRGATRRLEIELPSCLVVEPSLRPLAAPLVQDFLSRAAIECSRDSDLEQGLQELAGNCPRLVDAAVMAHDFPGSKANIGSCGRLLWLASLLGLESLERQQRIKEEELRSSQIESTEISK